MGDHYSALNNLSIMNSKYLSKRYELFPTQQERFAAYFPEQDNPYALAGMPGGDKAVVLTIENPQEPANYNLRGEEGNLVKLSKAKEKLVDIPYIREKIHLKKHETRLLRRIFAGGKGGEAAMQGSTVLIGRLLGDLKKRMTIRHNASRASILTTGKLIIKIAGVTYTIDYKIPAANKVTKTGTARWSVDTGRPLTDIAYMVELVQKACGLDAVTIVSRRATLTMFLEHKTVEARLSDAVKQQLLATGQVGSVLGLNWVTDDTGYKDNTGTWNYHYPANEVFIYPAAGTFAYMEKGETDDFDAPDFSTGTFVKSFIEKEPSRITLIGEDSRLPVLGIPGAIGNIKVNG